MGSVAPGSGHRWGRWGRCVLPLWCVVLTGVVLWPFAVAVATGWGRGGALLLRDMSVPGTMTLNDLATGADGVARAVPQDAVLAVLSPLVPPPVVVGLLMLGCGVAGSLGAAVLAGRCGAGTAGQLTASALVPWNPYLAERLLQGHWSVVAAGMLLPLVALLALLAWPASPAEDAAEDPAEGPAVSGTGAPRRRRSVGPVTALVVALAVCALTPTGLILGATTAVVASGWRRATVTPLVAGLILSLPWVVPSVLHASGTLTDAHGADLFAARAEPLVGTVGALAGLGGIWNADAVPAHRFPVAGVLLALVAVAVLLRWRGRGPGESPDPGPDPGRDLGRERDLGRKQGQDRRPGQDGDRWPALLRRLSWLAAGAVLVPALLATPPGLAVLGGLLETVPGAGLLRDTQKFVVLALPALVVLVSRADVLVPARWSGAVPAVLVAVLAVLQVPALPADLADLRPVVLDARYAAAVTAVEDAGGGRTLLWPPGNYRIIDGRPALDPLLKMLPGAPVDPGYLVVDGRLVDGDPATVRLLGDLATGTADRSDLADAGIDLVLVEGDAVQDGGTSVPAVPAVPAALSGADPVWSDGPWSLYRVR